MCDMLDDHNQIRSIITELRTELARPAMPTTPMFATARWSLTRHLLRHLAVESTIIRRDGRTQLDGDPLEERYRRHVSDWQPGRIQRDWVTYRRELNGLLDALDRRMDFEDREYYGGSAPIEVAFDRGIAMRYASF